MSPKRKSDRTYYFWWPEDLQSQGFGLIAFDLASFTEGTGYLKDSPFFILNIFPFWKYRTHNLRRFLTFRLIPLLKLLGFFNKCQF